jgi:hypothetical protein
MSEYVEVDSNSGRTRLRLIYRQAVGLVLICLSINVAFAQLGTGTIQGTILNEETRDIVQDVEVGVHLNGQQIAKTFTNEDGKYRIAGLKPDKEYVVTASKSSSRMVHIYKCQVNKGQLTFCDFLLQAGFDHQEPLLLIHGSSDTMRTAKYGEGVLNCRGRAVTVVTAAGVNDTEVSPKITSSYIPTRDTLTFEMLWGTPAMKENK